MAVNPVGGVGGAVPGVRDPICRIRRSLACSPAGYVIASEVVPSPPAPAPTNVGIVPPPPPVPAAKLAVQLTSAVIVSVTVGWVPVQPPLQPVNTKLPAGVAVSDTDVPDG